MVIQVPRRTRSTKRPHSVEELPPAERGSEYWAERRKQQLGKECPILPVEPDIYTEMHRNSPTTNFSFDGSKPEL